METSIRKFSQVTQIIGCIGAIGVSSYIKIKFDNDVRKYIELRAGFLAIDLAIVGIILKNMYGIFRH